jgi:hypothetical protein
LGTAAYVLSKLDTWLIATNASKKPRKIFVNGLRSARVGANLRAMAISFIGKGETIMSIEDTQQRAVAPEEIPVRAARIPGPDFDYLRTFARQAGHENTSAAVVRFAVIELARRLRREAEASVDKTAATVNQVEHHG